MEGNRLAELRRKAGKTGDAGGGAAAASASDSKQSEAMNAHVRQYDSIKEGLNSIRRNTARIEKLKDNEKTTVNEEARKDIMKELDFTMAETTREGQEIKAKLDKISEENKKYKKENPNSATLQMRVNLYQTHVRRLHQVMNGYNQASHDFKKALKDRTRRQLAIVDHNITPEQMDAILESGHADQVLNEVLISEELDNVVRDIEERHKGILRLEQQVTEVYQLFQDLATLVDMQQETLDVIENRVSMAKNYQGQALEELVKGEEYQKKARRRQICILMIILTVALAIILFFSVSN